MIPASYYLSSLWLRYAVLSKVVNMDPLVRINIWNQASSHAMIIRHTALAIQ